VWLVDLPSGALQEVAPQQSSDFFDVAQAGRLNAITTAARRNERDFMAPDVARE
jgi:hypothetical protein